MPPSVEVPFDFLGGKETKILGVVLHKETGVILDVSVLDFVLFAVGFEFNFPADAVDALPRTGFLDA